MPPPAEDEVSGYASSPEKVGENPAAALACLAPEESGRRIDAADFTRGKEVVVGVDQDDSPPFLKTASVTHDTASTTITAQNVGSFGPSDEDLQRRVE